MTDEYFKLKAGEYEELFRIVLFTDNFLFHPIFRPVLQGLL